MDNTTKINSDWFNDSYYCVGPPLTHAMIVAAETALEYRLPLAYIELLYVKNGGSPRQNCFPTQEPTGWADDHVQIDQILGIGGDTGIDSAQGSRYMIDEWEYPDVGIAFAYTPSAGHEVIMLDYSHCGPQGEPQVIYVDTETADCEPNIVVLAHNFEEFINGFVDCSNFSVYDE